MQYASLNSVTTMKTLLLALLLGSLALTVKAQSIIGKWQLIKQTTCIETDIETDEETEEMVNEMKSRDSGSAQIVYFKDSKSGEESTRILLKRKEANSKNFLYKFDGSSLYILDKRSQTISESYIVEKLAGDSLIVSSAARACDLKIFLRIK